MWRRVVLYSGACLDTTRAADGRVVQDGSEIGNFAHREVNILNFTFVNVIIIGYSDLFRRYALVKQPETFLKHMTVYKCCK